MSVLTEIKSKNNKVLNLSKIGIVYNTDRKTASKVAEDLKGILNRKGFSGIQSFAVSGKENVRNFEMPDITMAFIIGGDGTLLGASRFFAPQNIPLCGINIGRLGFLSRLVPSELQSGTDKILSGNFNIDGRIMLKSENSENPGSAQTALNDIVIKGGDISRTMQLFLYINDRHVCDYLADGLIISTPTGSTAYTLSAGGPVIVPESETFVITPICPHSLTVRPIVIPSDERITVRINSDSESVYVTADGQENEKISGRGKVCIRKYEHNALLVQTEGDGDNGFYGILRKKLHWGVAPFS